MKTRQGRRSAHLLAVPCMLLAAGALAQDRAPERPAPAPERPTFRIEAPNTRVEVDASTGRTRIEAPRTFVSINPEAGTAVVRAPFFSLDVRW